MPHTIHTLFIMCQRSLSQTCFGTAGRVGGAGSSPARPAWTGQGPRVLIAFVPPGVWGRKEVICVFWGSWAVTSLRSNFSSPDPLNLVADGEWQRKPAERLTAASVLWYGSSCFSFFLPLFQPVGVGRQLGQAPSRGGHTAEAWTVPVSISVVLSVNRRPLELGCLSQPGTVMWEREKGAPFPRVEAGTLSGGLGLKEPPSPLFEATEFISPHHQHPGPFISGWEKILLASHLTASTTRHPGEGWTSALEGS